MCMITYLPSGVAVPEREILNGGTWNDDGHGWAVAAGIGNMIVGKSMSLDDALDGFVACREQYPDAPALFHSRWATHGSKNTDNVHPFPVTEDSVLAHNGVMPSAFHPEKGDDRSDTRVFADMLSRDTDGLFSRRYRKRLGQMIGSGNKLVILSVNPRFLAPKGWIINQHRGEWDKATGAWFSNGDYYAKWDRHGWGSTSYYGSGAIGGNVTVLGGKPKELEPVKVERTYGPDHPDWAAYVANDECPVCWSYRTIDHRTGYCGACTACVDCGENAGDCICYIPASAFGPDDYDENGRHAADSRQVTEYLDRGRGYVAPWGDLC